MKTIKTPKDVLTPDALRMIEIIHQEGSFAAAARQMSMVPSALTYRVRQMEDALDVLLFDRSARQAYLTRVGKELLKEGQRLLLDMDAIANRIRRIATGWESELTIAVDAVIDRNILMELCAEFLSKNPPTRLRFRDEAIQGSLHALQSGQADLAIGIPINFGSAPDILHEPLGSVRFVFAVTPDHPLAKLKQPLQDSVLRQYRAVAVADTIPTGPGMTIGLLPGQDVLTVPSMQIKLDAQLRGLGVGFLPEPLARPYIDSGQLQIRSVMRQDRSAHMGYGWRKPQDADHPSQGGKALQWWLNKLSSTKTRQALLGLSRQGVSKRVKSIL